MEIHNIKLGITNCYLIKDKGIILIDTGMPGEFDKFTRGLADLNISPEQISLIVTTHGHWDHFGNLKQIRELTGAKVLAQKNDRPLIEKGVKFMPPGVTKWGKTLRPLLKIMLKKFSLEPAIVDIETNEEDFSLLAYGINGKVVFTPGHSPGSISVVLDTGEAFVGDMAMNGPPLTLSPSLPIFAEDMSAVKTSWKKLLDKGVKKVYPAHGAAFGIDKLKEKIA